jgi:PelA/Pel-15E family pectate lyase
MSNHSLAISRVRALAIGALSCALSVALVSPTLLAQGAPSEGDGAALVSAARIATLPPAQRAPWTAYLAQSRADRLRDSALIVDELRVLGKSHWTQPAVVPDFRVNARWTAAWYASDSAAQIATTMLSFQTPSGGWTKHADMFGAPRAPGVGFFSETAGWDYTATIDNSATTTQLEFLARLIAVKSTPAYRDSFARGIGYLLRAQYPSGGWPQVYPLQGGYHDATTYNDDATINVVRVLENVARGRFAWIDAGTRARARAAVARALAGILADQVVVQGERTVWGQQHDPFTREPVRARSYELAGLTGGESAGVLAWLMSMEQPSPDVVRAVHAGVSWLAAHRIAAVTYDSIAGTYRADSTAASTWARIYEVPSFRPIMANRDGITRYDFNALTDRRTGYAWFIQRPVAVLDAFPAWSRLHPLPSR